MFGPPFSPSLALGVDHCAISPFSSISSERAPLRVFRPPSTSATVGAGHWAASRIIVGMSHPARSVPVLVASAFAARAVGHCDPPVAGPFLWTVDCTSRDFDRPAGVTDAFQISADSVEPSVASLSRNLFSHDERGPLGVDEAK
jgi:hypothetical protein